MNRKRIRSNAIFKHKLHTFFLKKNFFAPPHFSSSKSLIFSVYLRNNFFHHALTNTDRLFEYTFTVLCFIFYRKKSRKLVVS
jgi:hypothetical protein